MKALSMPISSPSRADNFPPPLMSFLRSNLGSKSRGRSRSSPIFYIRRQRNSTTVIETTQEPSSPKVTCIGQVKSKARKSSAAAVNRHHRRRRRWSLKKALFCGKFLSRFYSQRRVFRRIFCKWVLFLRGNYCKKVDAEEDCFKVVHSNQKSEKSENLVGESDSCSKNFVDDCSSPPKNGFILTRCRSAPYRSSSLGGRFWSSPFAENDEKPEELKKAICEKNEKGNSRINSQEISSENFENSVNNDEDLKGIMGVSVHPLLLTRCKSEPARRGERLNPQANLWRQRRLG